MEKSYTSNESKTLDEFEAAREQLAMVIAQLQTPQASQWRHEQAEEFIHNQGQELCRLLFQGALDVRSHNELRREKVTGEDNVVRAQFRKDCRRKLTSMFGEVSYHRQGYRSGDADSRFPLDAELNIPKKKYTYGLQECVSLAVSKNAFDSALEGLSELLGGTIPKRQAEELVRYASCDFEAFYAQRAITPVCTPATVLVMSQDGKGINTCHGDLREGTRKAAEKDQSQKSVVSRLGSGKKRNRKRMATVASVYDLAPNVRTSTEVFGPDADNKQPNPKAENKRVWASLEEQMETVTEQIVQEAMRRDPNRTRPWVMLIDGHNDQIRVIKRVFKRHDVDAPLILDLVHVLEYLWRAAWCFYSSADREEAEKWVQAKAIALLEGRSGNVAAGIRIKAKDLDLSEKRRETIDTVARYLTNHTKMLRYDQFMAQGFPIASGVIEGACRHLINDRFEITGARWSVKTAEGVLRLRAIRSSDDWDLYQAFHKKMEWTRNHFRKFAAGEQPSMDWK